jgi:CHAT domain-containing protein
MLVAPAAVPRGSRVIVIPDGRLHALNLETLVAPSPRPHYWIEDAIITTAPSLQLLGKAALKTSRELLLVGNAPSADRAFPRLKFAADEMQRVARRFDRASTKVLDDTRATPRAYAASTPESYAYIHFVAHGIATRTRPLESAVVLARDGDSYKLYARDIVSRPLRARLVTISSCHGAGVRAYAGEGLVGLAWAFLRAGAREVVAALWEVNDSAAPELMDRMYAGIRAGRDPAVALREAKLVLLRAGGVRARPLYWAPFVLYSAS